MLNSVVLVCNLIIPPLLNLLYALVLLLIGWVIAKLLQWVVALVLKAIQLDKGASAVGLTPILAKGEIKKPLSDLLGDLVYWVAIVVTMFSTVSFLGLGSAVKLFNGVLSYITGVLSAAIALGAAMFLASLISSLVLLVANNIGLLYAKTLSKVIYYSMIIFGVVITLGLLGVDAGLIVASFSVVVGGIFLAAAIAFGLGCKDIAADFITNLFKQK